MAPNAEKTRALLERAYLDFHRERHRNLDPISLVHHYPEKRDREVVALLAALLSYGNVKTIISSVSKLLAPLGKSPHSTLLEKRSFALWGDFKHRFTTGADIEILAHWIASALKSQGTLENFFISATRTSESNPVLMKDRLSAFVQQLSQQKLPSHLIAVRQHRLRSLKYLVSDPQQGSACKRLNMFLRWVVRPDDGIDLGLWQKIHPRELMLPVDTHLLQTLQKLQWTQSKNATWQVVESATKKLRNVFPEDPIRYDFALCHLSMSGGNIRAYSKPPKVKEGYAS